MRRTAISPTLTATLAVVALALAIAPATATAAAQRTAGGEVHPVKSTYTSTEKIAIAWSGFATGEVYFWMVPEGTPRSGFARGSYHSSYEESGSYALNNPGPGAWEVHWTVLGEDTVYSGGPFRVQAAQVARVRGGHYGCYTTTTFGLTRSSMQSIRILSKTRYRAMGRTGRYRYSRKAGKLRMTSGPLAKRVAQYRPGGDEETIVFLRRENEVRGKPTIDVSDTFCYRGRD